MTIYGFSENKGKHEVCTYEKIITGEEYATNEYVNGKQVYGKRINIEALPNNGNSYTDTGFKETDIEVVRLIGIAKKLDNNQYICLPHIHVTDNTNFIALTIVSVENQYKILIETGRDRTNCKAIIEMYYTKN